MISESLLRIGRIGININGDFDDEVLVEKALKASEYVNVVWIGDSDFFKDPFYLADLFIENTDLIVGFGILRVKNYHRILNELEKFSGIEERVIVGVAAGDKGSIETTVKCIQKLKEKFEFPVVAGGTGKKALSRLSRVADGILLNHISPHHVNHVLRYVNSDFVSAYGPCLILPSHFEQDLLLATAMIMGSSKSFVEDMGYTEIFEKVRAVDIISLIGERQRGNDLNKFEEFRRLQIYRNFLFENFSISGSIDEVSNKIALLLEMCNHVVLSDPFFREEKFDRFLKKIIQNVNEKI